MVLIILAIIFGIFTALLIFSRSFQELTLYSAMNILYDMGQTSEKNAKKRYRNKLNDQTKAVRIEWTNDLAGDFAFKDSWVYCEGDVNELLRKDTTLAVVGYPIVRVRTEEQDDDDQRPVIDEPYPAKPIPDRRKEKNREPAFLSLETFCKHWESREPELKEEYIFCTHYPYTIEIDGLMRGFVAAVQVGKNKVECQSNNFNIGFSETLCLNLFFSGKTCYPVVADDWHMYFLGKNMDAPPSAFDKVYPCIGGSIKVDKTYWDKGIIKAAFDFTFRADFCPNGEFSLTGRIYAPIKYHPKEPITEENMLQYEYQINLYGKYN